MQGKSPNLNLQNISLHSFCKIIVHLLFRHAEEVQDQILLFIIQEHLRKNNYVYKNKELYYFSDDFLLLKVKSKPLDSNLLSELRTKIREWIKESSVEDFFLFYKSIEKNQKEFVELISDIALGKYNSTLKEGARYSSGLFKLEDDDGKFILRGRVSGKQIKTIIE